MLSLGSQYFQLGSVGLLAATPLSEAEGVAIPLSLGIWEREAGSRTFSVLLGRVRTDFDEESGLAVNADDYAAVRVGFVGEQSLSGLNLLLSGRGQEQGISWDRTDAGGSRLEVAVARANPAAPWHIAGYGEWAVPGWSGWTVQLGYVPIGYPVGYAQLADLGGSLPLASGEIMLGITGRWTGAAGAEGPRSGTPMGTLRVYSTRASGLAGEARLGWEGAVWPAVTLRAEWTQWALSASSYGRGRIELAYLF